MTHDLISAAWYLARGSGLSSLVLFSIVVALGIGSRSGRALFGLPRFAVQAVHSTAALTAVGFLAVHVVSLLFDPYAQLRLLDLVVPFAGAYRPLWLGLGTLALDLMLAVVVTSLFRRRLSLLAWKAVHYLAYLACHRQNRKRRVTLIAKDRFCSAGDVGVGCVFRPSL